MCGRRSVTPDSALRVVYDGGPLVFSPGGPPALHIMELLEALPATIDPWLALPAGLELPALSKSPHILVEPTRSRTAWEQVTFPTLIRRARPDLVHLTTLQAPFFCPAPCIISPAEPFKVSTRSGHFSRLGEALGRGGVSRARGILWPEDLPEPAWDQVSVQALMMRLPPHVHRAFDCPQTPPADLPDAYVFCPGPLGDEDLVQLAATWRMAGVGLGENYTLLLGDASPGQVQQLRGFFQQAQMDLPVESISLLDAVARAAVFQRASEVICLGPVLPWGDSFLQALACGQPLVGTENPLSDARVGPAGYLALPGDARALGAAVITPLVEEQVREQLMTAAHERAAAWQSDLFSSRLEDAYRRAIAT